MRVSGRMVGRICDECGATVELGDRVVAEDTADVEVMRRVWQRIVCASCAGLDDDTDEEADDDDEDEDA